MYLVRVAAGSPKFSFVSLSMSVVYLFFVVFRTCNFLRYCVGKCLRFPSEFSFIPDLIIVSIRISLFRRYTTHHHTHFPLKPATTVIIACCLTDGTTLSRASLFIHSSSNNKNSSTDSFPSSLSFPMILLLALLFTRTALYLMLPRGKLLYF